MRGRARAVLAVGITTVAMLAAACGGGGETTPGTTESGGAGGEISIRGCTPENPLVPGNTSEVCGGNVVSAINAMLVHYNADTAAPENDVAESITPSADNKLFTIKLKPYKFQDGTDLKAKNFVDAWNYTANGANGQAGSYFFSPIAGYADVQCPDEECKQKPKAETMSGLKVVDDTTFTITTTEPVSNLPVRLGYSAFAPLPDSFFADPKAYEDKPVGAGPFEFVSKSTTEIVLKKFADYSGANKPNVDQVTFRIYQDDSAAYADVVANNLDFTDAIPADQLVGDAWKSDLDGRNGIQETGIMAWITFSPNDPQLKDNVELRKAISMSINRDEIAKQIFNGTVTPATSWVSPVVDGYKAGVCGDSCTFDAAAAKAAYEKAGGYKGTLTMTYNNDGAGNKDYSEAVCNQVKNNLGLECTAVRHRRLRDLQQEDRRRRPEGHVPQRLADGLPVDRELPDPDLRQGCRLQLVARSTTRSSRSCWPRRQPPRAWTRRTRSTRRPRPSSLRSSRPHRCGPVRRRSAGRQRDRRQAERVRHLDLSSIKTV